jgi:hypothetical protein
VRVSAKLVIRGCILATLRHISGMATMRPAPSVNFARVIASVAGPSSLGYFVPRAAAVMSAAAAPLCYQGILNYDYRRQFIRR